MLTQPSLMHISQELMTRPELSRSARFSILEGCADAVLVVSGEAAVVYANTAAESLFAATAQRLATLPIDRLVQLDAQDGWSSLTALLVRSGSGATYEAVGHRLDGTEMALSVSASPLRGSGELKPVLLLTLRSAREQQSASLALAQREARFRALSEASPIGVFAADPFGACSYTNPRWQEIFGLTPDQSLGDAWLMSLQASELTQFRDEWQRACEERTEFEMVFGVVHRSGAIRQVRCRARPVVVAGQDVTGMVGSVEDVTERQVLLDRLRSSQVRERRLYEQTPTMLHSTDWQGQLLTVSERWLMKLRWTRNDVIGRSVYAFFTPDSAQLLRRVVQGELAQQGGHGRTLLQMTDRDGGLIDVECEVMLDRVAEDRPFRVIAVLEDVTERLRAQQALQSERQRLAYIIDGTQVGTWEWNVQTGEVRFNSCWAEMMGFTLDELMPVSFTTWTERAHPDDLLRSTEALRQHFDGESSAYECEVRVLHRDGRWIWVLARGRVMTRTEGGLPEWMFGTHQDITARKQQEASLQRSRELLDRTGRLATVGGWELDLDSHELMWSPEVCRIHGVSEDFQPDLSSAISFYAPEVQEQVANVVQRCMDHGEPWDFELPLIRKDGQQVWVRAVGRPDYREGKMVRLVGAFQDVTQQVAARQQLEETHQRLELANSSGHVGVWDLDLKGGQILWNDCMWQLYGIAPLPGGPTHAAWEQALHPEDRAATVAEFKRATALTREHELEFRVVHPTGDVRHLVAKFRVTRDVHGTAVRVTGVNWDVTEARKLQAQVAEQAEVMRVTLSAIVDAVITSDMQGRVLWMNQAAERMLGVSVANALGQSLDALAEVLAGSESEPVPATLKVSCQVGGDCTSCAKAPFSSAPLLTCHLLGAPQDDRPVRLVRRDGAEIHAERRTSPMRDAHGIQIGVVLVLHDVTEQRRLLNEVSFRASHDDLTGLLNRAAFAERLNTALHEAQASEQEHAMLYIDLDQFKIVNDTSGHAVGDRLLQQVARLLSRSMRHRDTLARLGGDEFGVLLWHCTAEQSLRVAQQICEQLDTFRFHHDGSRLRVGASVGLVPVDARWQSVSAIMQAADSACYAAKEAGRNRVHAWIDTDRDLKARTGDLQWAASIEQALDEDRFVLFHQRIEPISRPGSGLRAEVLVRLRQTDGSLAPPGAFLPAAERFHLATRLDRWVLRSTIAWLQSLDNLDAIESLSINLSGQSIGDRAFHQQTTEELAALPPNLLAKLCLEVTETAAVTNLGDAADFISAVRSLGLRIALDDFGAGASSFGYLKSLPVDYLKIDGQFIRNLIEDRLDAEAVRCFVKVAQVVGVKTVAEFVDRAEVLAMLEKIGVDYAQGYLLHKPSPLDTALKPEA